MDLDELNVTFANQPMFDWFETNCIKFYCSWNLQPIRSILKRIHFLMPSLLLFAFITNKLMSPRHKYVCLAVDTR